MPGQDAKPVRHRKRHTQDDLRPPAHRDDWWAR
jgi:hypothetical protein